jgi:hypothetical protein
MARISFMFKGKKRTQLFLKYPNGTNRPEGDWECHCGVSNLFTKSDEQYCVSCGTKLKITQNLDARQKMVTLVRVGHVEPNGSGGHLGSPPPVV